MLVIRAIRRVLPLIVQKIQHTCSGTRSHQKEIFHRPAILALRQKTIWTVALSLTSLVGVSYFIASTVILKGYAQLEHQDVEKNVARVLEAYEQSLEELNISNYSWSCWDDSYRFIQQPYDEYVEANLHQDVFVDMNVNVILFINTSGQLVEERAYDLETQQAIPVPFALKEYIQAHPNLWQHSSVESSFAGTVLLGKQPLMLTSRPIVTSLGEGPIQGTLIMGRYLNADTVEQLAQTTRLELALHPIQDRPLPVADWSPFISSREPVPVLVEAQTPHLISGYTVIDDLAGYPALLVQIDLPRAIYKQGQASISYLFAALLTVGCTFGLAIQPLLKKLLQLWWEQQESEAALRKSEATSRALLEAIPDLMMRMHRDGTYLDFIPAEGFQLVVPDQPMVGKTVYDILPGAIADQRLNYIHRALETGEIQIYDFQLEIHGKTWYQEARIVASGDDEVLVIVRDFTERFQAEAALRESKERLAWQSNHDDLTGLPNRREFERQLENVLVEVKQSNRPHVLCYLDLDQFKIVNDTCGHSVGDELLRQLAALLQRQIRPVDHLARLGGDEFVLLLYDCNLEQAVCLVNTLRQSIQEFRFVWQEQSFTLGVSIGVVLLNADTANPGFALSAADAACYVAKNRGRNRIHVCQVDDQELVQQRDEMEWVARITKALETNQFCLYCQPIVPVQLNRGIEHYEILIRLQDEAGKLIPPGNFIPAAERYNLMQGIDRWVIQTLFAFHTQHQTQLEPPQRNHHCLYAINLSGASINDEQFIEFLHKQFTLHQISPALICFEITETVAITNLARAIKFIWEFKHLGCQFALDDFGSGMSSFAYLKDLPVDYLKIDGAFVKDILDNSAHLAMVEAIHRVGHVMKLKTIAEFVESDSILNKLKAVGVDYAQGYGIAQPCPLNPDQLSRYWNLPLTA